MKLSAIASILFATAASAIANPVRLVPVDVNLPVGSVKSTHIGNGEVKAIDIAESAVTSSEIADRTIVAGDIGKGEITQFELQDITLYAVVGAGGAIEASSDSSITAPFDGNEEIEITSKRICSWDYTPANIASKCHDYESPADATIKTTTTYYLVNVPLSKPAISVTSYTKVQCYVVGKSSLNEQSTSAVLQANWYPSTAVVEPGNTAILIECDKASSFSVIAMGHTTPPGPWNRSA